MIRSTARFAVLVVLFFNAGSARAVGVTPVDANQVAMNDDSTQTLELVDPIIEEPIRPLFPESSTSPLRATQCGSMQLLVPPLILFLLSSMRLVSHGTMMHNRRTARMLAAER